MEDSLSTIFAMIIAIILMFLFPLIDSWDLQDNLSYVVAYASTVDFVDTVRNTGFIPEELYDNFVSKLYATGNTYDISMEHRKRNDDLDAYLYVYTNEIMDDLEKGIIAKNPLDLSQTTTMYAHKLNQFDYFYVTVKNTNRTQATILSDFFTSGSGTNTKIAVAYGGIVWSSRDDF